MSKLDEQRSSVARWAWTLALVLALLSMPTSLHAAPDNGTPQLALSPFLDGLDAPVFMLQAEDGRFFIVERGGRILIRQDGALLDTPFLDISPKVADYGECGLLSMAFAPDYVTSGVFYVYYSDAEDRAEPTIDGEPNGGCDTVVARFRVSPDPNRADGNSEEAILELNQPDFNHNGGQIAFGPDGYLYIALGDGGGGGDPHELAQNPQSLLGKMLRVQVGASGGYSIPPDNPFVGNAAYKPAIWALGLRNPWRFSFDRATGDLFISDVGQESYEEINLQPVASSGGENYGWNVYEGVSCYNDNPACGSDRFVDPIIVYGRRDGSTVTGGYRYRGGNYPNLAGLYFYADYGSGNIWGAAAGESGWQSQLLLETTSERDFVSFAEDNDGALYLIDINGSIERLTDLNAFANRIYLPLAVAP